MSEILTTVANLIILIIALTIIGFLIMKIFPAIPSLISQFTKGARYSVCCHIFHCDWGWSVAGALTAINPFCWLMCQGCGCGGC